MTSSIQYISTRGQDAPISFADALLAGLARDGGLYLPTAWPQFAAGELESMVGRPYAEISARIMAKFTGDDISLDELLIMTRNAYATFSAEDVAPLTRVNDQIHLCELYHGPTIAFKDVAMQVLSRLFDHQLEKRGTKAVILGATSGDTGSAALEAFRDRNMVDIFILYPDGRVSPVQEQQMTSVIANGAYAVAVGGDFDDCQAIVKSLFGDLDFRDQVGLSAINSINWARLMPQIVYYVTSTLALGGLERPLTFAVPTGNFGNIFAGYAAMKMGLPVKRFICASNRNDILTRFFDTGKMERRMVEPSLSPSMDIQVSSNFERLMFELLGRDGDQTRDIMNRFNQSGEFTLTRDMMGGDIDLFTGFRCDDAATLDEIGQTWRNDGIMVDPHSAIGTAAARAATATSGDDHIVALACAHPAKFPDAVEKATGIRPELPPHLADLLERPHQRMTIAATADAVANMITEHKR